MPYPVAIHNVSHLFPKLRYIDTFDIRDDSPANITPVDYRMANLPQQYDLIITNPPFFCAAEIIEKAFRDVRHNLNTGGYIVMLQRLNFLGSASRLNFWHRFAPYRIFVHSQRMGFKHHLTELPKKERNQTDSIEYAHFVWWTGWNESYCPCLRVI